MKERPIIFSAPMVRAILDGRKTQTRRVILRPERFTGIRDCAFCCPYGAPGDLLWVRENFYERFDGLDDMDFAGYCADRELTTGQCPATAFDALFPGYIEKRPSIFMPRRYSRLTLRVTDVRVQRVQEVSNADARAEGVIPDYAETCIDLGHPYDAIPLFRQGWDLINGKRAPWSSNPWVWAITFERVEKKR